MATLEQLQETSRKTQQAINRIQDAERRERNGPLVGKHFKVQNNYSVPEKRSDYWWRYAKVLSMDGSGYLRTLWFEIDKNGRITVEFDFFTMSMRDDWQQIGGAEFGRAWRKVVEKVRAVRI